MNNQNDNKETAPSKLLYVSLFLLSVSVIAFQIVLMQLLSYVQWYHFAYMIISVALLGFGAAGSLLAVNRVWLVNNSEQLLPFLMISSGIAFSIVIPVAQWLFGDFESYLLFVDTGQIFYLLFTYLLFALPFVFSGLAIGIIFVKHVNKISFLYFSNLTGSGFGGLFALIIIPFFLPNELPSIIGITALLSGILIITSKRKILFIFYAVTGFLFNFYFLFFPVELHLSEYKGLTRTLNLPDAEIVYEKNSHYGLVQTVSSAALRYAPGLSLNYRGEIPVRKAIFINGDWFGHLLEWGRNDSLHLLNHTTAALPYVLTLRKKVLTLNSGTGMNSSHALSNNAEKVFYVEPNSEIISLLKNNYAAESDSFLYHPDVKVETVEGRSFLMQTNDKFDAIVLPTIESFGGSSGIYALKEQYHLTGEAFLKMWHLLSDDGVIAVTSWMDYPVRNPLKILATIVFLLEENGIENIQNHIAAVRSWGTVTFIVKKNKINENEIDNLISFCNQMSFDPLLYPGIEQSERMKYNQLQDTLFFFQTDLLLSDGNKKFIDEYDFNIHPASDNRPYFSQFLKLGSVRHLLNTYGRETFPFLEIGYLIIVVTFIQIIFAAFILIILPLFKIGWRGEKKLWTLFYFSGLGLGFMFVEIVFIQKFILYFGNPVYAVSAVISGMLLFSGAGSFFSSRIKSENKRMVSVLGTIIFFIILYLFLLDYAVAYSITFSLTSRIIFSILMIAPLAFIMGMPFPLGLRFLSLKNKKEIPWAWGINSCFSVISTVLATIIAVETGFQWVMIIAAAAYSWALLISLKKE